ncbi:MAG: hypothetical protein AB1576_05015 [Bacillota bacterium]
MLSLVRTALEADFHQYVQHLSLQLGWNFLKALSGQIDGLPIVASRLKSMPAAVIKEVFSDDYVDIQEMGLKYKVVERMNAVRSQGKEFELPERLVITYSEARARKDSADRERLIEKAKGLLESASKIRASNKRGGKKYLKEMSGETEWVLDEDAIANDSRYDGYYGIQTNDTITGNTSTLTGIDVPSLMEGEEFHSVPFEDFKPVADIQACHGATPTLPPLI